MSKDDKSRTDLSHLGPPAMARRFSSRRDEIAKFEKVPVSELGKPTLRSADAALAAANKRVVDLAAEVTELKALLAARDEALAAALELAQSRAQTVTPTVTAPSTSAVTPVTLRNAATATAAERQRAWRERRKAKLVAEEVAIRTATVEKRDAKG